MKYYLDRIYKIMVYSRNLADAGEWANLEDYADSKIDEVISLINKALKARLSEDMRWEVFSALTGSHHINVEIGPHHVEMSLNIEGGDPILQIT
jgi:hypothetical protein